MLDIYSLTRILATIFAVFILAGCDDDSKKDTPEYEVEIYFSEDVKIEWQKMKGEGHFKKPRVQVHHPEGVDVTHVERGARKKIVYDFSTIDLSLALAFGIAWASRWARPRPFLSRYLPTYHFG